MEIRPPRPEEVGPLLAMLTRAYRAARPDFPDDPSVLGAYSEHDPDGIERWVVAFDGPRPVSALRLFVREASGTDGRPVRFGGIGNVGTDPDASGRGLASAVMRAAHRRLLDEGIPSAVLVTDIPDFYARLGYEVVTQPERRLTLSSPAPSRDARAGMQTSGAPRARDIAAGTDPGADATAEGPGHTLVPPVPDEVAAAHRRAAEATPGRVLRTRALWDDWILTFKRRGGGLDAVHRGGAYWIGRPEDDGASFRVFEAGGDADAVLALLRPGLDGVGLLKMPDDALGVALSDRLGGEVAIRVRTGIMAVALAPGAPGADAFGGFLELDAF